MIKLVENELIKIFKRKSIYLLFLLSFIGIIVYNNINPDQNLINNSYKLGTEIDYPISEISLENTNSIEDYIGSKSNNDIHKLCNSFEQKSWQRYALVEESTLTSINNVYTDYNLDLDDYLNIINDYEINTNTEITTDLYENAKEKYNEYVSALNSNDWRQYVNLKIKNLKERKNSKELLKDEIDAINFEIEVYNLRLNNNINFGNDILNDYLKAYRNNLYALKSYETSTFYEPSAFINKNTNDYKSRLNICKYVIENNIKQDVSNENNIIPRNKIDARICFIRTFKNFDIIIVIIAIYISTTIVTEETNKRTMKNLLTKPHKRSKIIISKIIACVITVIISMIFVVISQYLIGGIIFGFDSYNLDYIGYNFNNNEIVTMNLIKYICIVAILKLPIYITIILLCIFMGVINDNQAMTMILTLIIFLAGSILLKEWSKVESLSVITRYFITNNWDFTVYMFGQISDIRGITLCGSIINCSIHFIILLFLIIHKFNKKEIVNV